MKVFNLISGEAFVAKFSSKGSILSGALSFDISGGEVHVEPDPKESEGFAFLQRSNVKACRSEIEGAGRWNIWETVVVAHGISVANKNGFVEVNFSVVELVEFLSTGQHLLQPGGGT